MSLKTHFTSILPKNHEGHERKLSRKEKPEKFLIQKCFAFIFIRLQPSTDWGWGCSWTCFWLCLCEDTASVYSALIWFISVPKLSQFFCRRLSCFCSGRPYRLVEGSSRCSGILEVKHEDEWRPVSSYDSYQEDAAVVCRKLHCGSEASVDSTERSSFQSTWEISFKCVRSGSPLRECIKPLSTLFVMEITCSGESITDIISFFLCHTDSQWFSTDWNNSQVGQQHPQR